jgi:hypothetical protein
MKETPIDKVTIFSMHEGILDPKKFVKTTLFESSNDTVDLYFETLVTTERYKGYLKITPKKSDIFKILFLDIFNLTELGSMYPDSPLYCMIVPQGADEEKMDQLFFYPIEEATRDRDQGEDGGDFLKLWLGERLS